MRLNLSKRGQYAILVNSSGVVLNCTISIQQKILLSLIRTPSCFYVMLIITTFLAQQ
jgi:hypothetical protein